MPAPMVYRYVKRLQEENPEIVLRDLQAEMKQLLDRRESGRFASGSGRR
nr:hypothetical protein TetV2_00454 [Oceanusvirus sp.]